MNKMKILGIGSPFGDDQVGWAVIEILKSILDDEPALYPWIVIEHCDRPGARLVEMVDGCEDVYLIDAVKSGATTGTIHKLQRDEILTFNGFLSSHHFGVPQALEMASALGQLPARITLYGIEINETAPFTEMNQALNQAIHSVADQIRNDVKAQLQLLSVVTKR